MSLRWPLVLALLLAACGDGGEPAPPSTASTTTTSPRTSTTVEARGFHLEQVGEFDMPLALAHVGDRVLVAENHTGRVRELESGDTVLDLDVSTGGEQGLLGLAISPDGDHLYVDYTDPAGDTRVVEYTAQGERPKELLFADQPASNHNGGALVFGPDDRLYVAVGEGGGGSPSPAQSDDSYLGKLVRIGPGGPEVWVKGLRNPWRFSFDRKTGDLWIGDVGQNAVEEIDHLPAGRQRGANLGWDLMEGTRTYRGNPPEGHVPPVHEYPLEGGACAVTGGYVYRGDDIPELRDRYLFADFCIGEVMALDPGTGEVEEVGVNVPQLASFAEAPDGELYLLSLAGPVYRLVPGPERPAERGAQRG